MKTNNLLLFLIGGIVLTFFVFKTGKPLIIKEKNDCFTDTVYIRDTIYISNPEFIPASCDKTKTALLTAGEWELDEVHRRDIEGISTYVRNQKNTTGIDYSKLKLKFNIDGSGVYTDNAGNKHSMNWNFIGDDERNAVLMIDGTYGDKFYWHNIEVSENYLHSTCPYKGDLLLSTRYIRSQ